MNTVTADQAQVNKGFLDSMSLIDADGCSGAAEDNDQESRYAYLASDEQLNADETDFSDPAALLTR